MVIMQKMLGIATLLALVSCSERNDASKTASAPPPSQPKEQDQVAAPSEIAGAFADFECGAEAPGIVCKMRSKDSNAEVYLDLLTIKPEFELILSQSILPNREDVNKTSSLRKIALTTSQVSTKWGLVIDAEPASVNELIHFLKSSFLNPDTTLGIVLKNPKNSDPRLIARLDRCTLVSFLMEWGYNPASKNTPGTLPTSVQSMLQTQDIANLTAAALRSQSLSCFSAEKKTELELKRMFSAEMLAAANEWFLKSKNSFKK